MVKNPFKSAPEGPVSAVLHRPRRRPIFPQRLSKNKIKMLFIIGASLLFFNHSYAQNHEKLFTKGLHALCKRDTALGLSYLSRYDNYQGEKKHEVSSLLLQALIYEDKREYDVSIKKLKAALDIYEAPESIQYINDPCNWAFNTLLERFDDPILISDYNLLITLSSISIKQSDANQAIMYLDKINHASIPGYSGCVNGVIKIETSIAIKKAACYLLLGDTSSALNNLIDYVIFEEAPQSDTLVRILKPLLLKKYTRAEILAEIENSIKSVKMTNDISPSGLQSQKIEYVLWGRKIPFLSYSYHDFMDFISENKNLNYIKSLE